MSTARSWLVLCSTAALAATLAAQQPVFRAGTDYVRVDVVVTDKNDRPIADLRKEDFEIVERDRPQTIEDFEFVSVPVTARASRSVERPGPPPDVASNAPPSISSRLFVIVIDDFHILEQDLVHTKQILTGFINALAPDDEVAVVFAGHSNLSQNFTTDRSLLLKTVDHVRDSLGFGLDALGQSMSSAVASTPGCYIHQMAMRSDLVLKNVAASLAGSSHARRAIVYVTAGSILATTPTEDICANDFDDLQEVYALARRADVPIYTIDPRGQVLPDEAVRGGMSAIGVLDQAPTATGSTGAGRRALIAANIQRQHDRLAEVAVNTGGRAFTAQSNLSRAVDEIVADNSSYYLLGYYPAPFAADGRFHTFSVNVKRPGVRVRARQGYVASKSEPATGDAKPVLDAAISAGVNVSAVSLRAFAAPISIGAKGMHTVITIDVTYPVRSDGSRLLDDDLLVNILAMDPDAKIKATAGRTAHFGGTAPGQGPITVVVNDAIELPSQPLTLRIAVASRALGKAGSVQMTVDVPKVSDNKLQLSGVVLGATSSSAAPTEADAIKDLVPFQPTTSRVFSQTDTLRVFARAFWGTKDAAVEVTLALTGTGSAPRRLTLNGVKDQNGRSETVLDTTLPLAGLAPGKYQLDVSAKIGKQTTKRTVPIEVR
ncbi:MAG TPA: VWA domain-containing protein [Vicinamibacterales bacterium]|nr:VWA domain-containing protein [Vicinamibacterales bacterium]